MQDAAQVPAPRAPGRTRRRVVRWLGVVLVVLEALGAVLNGAGPLDSAVSKLSGSSFIMKEGTTLPVRSSPPR